MTKVSVLGAGSWGTTVASMLSAQVDTVLWARSDVIAEEIRTRHTNVAYLGSHALPEDLGATSSLEEALASTDIVVVAIPSHGVRSVLSSVSSPGRDVVVLSLTKGLEERTHQRATEVIGECWEVANVGVLTGPNLALEVIDGQPTASVIAMGDEAVARDLQPLFTNASLRVYTNPDVVGCEIAGVAKNVMAIAIGMAKGLGFGDNTRAALITRSLAEIARLGVALGGDRLTFAGLAGLGDLVATCTSDKSRNFSLGVALGRGSALADITGGTRMVAEGVRSCRPVVELASRYSVEVPVAEQVVAVCHEGLTPREVIPLLMQRAAKSEFEGATSDPS